MVSSSKSHYPSRRSRRTAAVIATSLLTSSVSPVTAFAQDPVKGANNFVQGLAGNLPQAPAMPGLPAAPPPANVMKRSPPIRLLHLLRQCQHCPVSKLLRLPM